MSLLEERVVEIGEMPVRLRKLFCCGNIEWYGRFPDETTCCEFAEHTTYEEALECSKRRVAKGFTFEIPKKEQA